MQISSKKIAVYLTTLLLIFISISFLFLFGIFKNWDTSLSDKLFTTKPARGDIIIISIDDKSLSEIGRWPWDRSVHAELLNKLSVEGNTPAVIGLDISFFENSTIEEDLSLARALERTENEILAAEQVNGYTLTPPEELVEDSVVGIVNTISDSDGITRSIPIYGKYSSFSQMVALNYKHDLKLPDVDALKINYTGPPGSFTTYSYSDVLNERIDLRSLKGMIVLVGATSPGLHDTQMTPTSKGEPMAGVEIHASAVQTILDNGFLWPEQKLVTVLTILIFASVSIALFLKFSVYSSAAIALGLIMAYLLYAVNSFDNGTVRNLIYPPLVIIVSYVSTLAYKYFTEIKEKIKIRRAFSFYLSKPVMNQVLKDPEKLKLGGEKREITLLFSDIAGFTSISEKIDPVHLTTLLNKYLTKMTDIVHFSDGVLDKYIGDAVMAFWNEPVRQADHALRACNTAIEMMEEMKKMSPEWKKEGADLDIRIGVNTGEAVVGNMGSNERLDYTAIGDAVNLASRLEGINKAYGTSITISEHTLEKVKDKVNTRKIDDVAVKGKNKGVAIYELRGLGKPTAQEKKFLNEFEAARALYQKGKFRESLTIFKKVNQKYPKDDLTKVYLKRLENLIKNKPSSWDGVFKATSK